jgi:hypothetical protein
MLIAAEFRRSSTLLIVFKKKKKKKKDWEGYNAMSFFYSYFL